MALSSHPKVWQVLTAILVALVFLCGLSYFFSKIFIAFVIGFVLIIIAEKFGSDFQKSVERYKLSPFRRWCYGCALTLFWLFVIVFLLGNSLGQITGTLRQISVDATTVTDLYSQRIYPHLPVILRRDTVTIGVVDWISRYLSLLAGKILSQTFIFTLYGLLIIPLLFYVYFWRRKAIAKTVFDAVPKDCHKSVQRGARRIGSQLHQYFAARIIQSAVVGALCCLGFFIAGVKGWLVLGLLAGFLNTVPYFGPIMGAIPPIVFTLIADESIAVLFVILTVFIAQTIDVFYLQSFMIAGKIHIDPLLSIILVLAGTRLFGIFGTVFALPMYLVCKVILQEAYHELVRLYDPDHV
jgi:predicted PurR-regulated permease PerM